MRIDISLVDVEEIHPLRELYRREMNCQVICDSFARRGFTHPYLLQVDGSLAGYAQVAHRHYPNAVIEFYLLPGYRAAARPIFRRLVEVSGATHVHMQSNDGMLLLMLFDFTTEITTEAVLFEDRVLTHLPNPGGVLRQPTEADRARLKEQKRDDGAHWVIEAEGELVATGGILLHYNPPYGDLYMEVHPDFRRRGFGSYLIQELKRIAYESGKTPAARCNPTNAASRATLQKAGLLPCGHRLTGTIIRL